MNRPAARPARSRGARVAVLSDIHANLPALAAALRQADRLAGRVLVAGDIVGGGPHPCEVLRVLRERGAAAIAGNVDRKVLQRASRSSEGARRRTAGGNLEWTSTQLGATELEWLAALPGRLRVRIGDADVLVVHGSPRSDTDVLFPSLTRAALEQRLGNDRPAALVAGHTHIPFVRRVADVLVVNCGSVGRPYDGDPRGSFALIEADLDRPSARIVRFSYDVTAVAADVASRSVPGIDPKVFAAGVKKLGE